jgi:hypothetical protein
VAVTVTVLVGAAVGVEEPQAAASRASEVRQNPASALRPVIVDALMMDVLLVGLPLLMTPAGPPWLFRAPRHRITLRRKGPSP